MHSHEANVLTEQNETALEAVYPILKDIIHKIASLQATDARAVEFVQSLVIIFNYSFINSFADNNWLRFIFNRYGGTFKVLFTSLDLLTKSGPLNIKQIVEECDKVRRKIKLFENAKGLPDIQ